MKCTCVEYGGVKRTCCVTGGEYGGLKMFQLPLPPLPCPPAVACLSAIPSSERHLALESDATTTTISCTAGNGFLLVMNEIPFLSGPGWTSTASETTTSQRQRLSLTLVDALNRALNHSPNQPGPSIAPL